MWFIFKEGQLLVKNHKQNFVIPAINTLMELKLQKDNFIYIGRQNSICCFTAEVNSNFSTPVGLEFLNLPYLFEKMDSKLCQIASYAIQILNWKKNFQFCGRCSYKTVSLKNDRATYCPNCQLVNHPRISPAVIVAVIRDNRILLASAKRFKSKMYSVLAGFVEPGENLEECVKREILEEVNIEVKNIRYFGSQSWPFPNSLMIAFIADYKSGKIKIDKNELLDAAWFKATELPETSSKISIAGQLIDWFIKSTCGGF
jgi:NAD+ diphosphatase